MDEQPTPVSADDVLASLAAQIGVLIVENAKLRVALGVAQSGRAPALRPVDPGPPDKAA